MRERQPAVAVNAFREAQKIADVWLGRFDLGVAYVEAGHHAEALAELEIANKRRGEITAIFLDDVPSFRRIVPLYYWLGRAQEALGNKTAADNYKAFFAASHRHQGPASRRCGATAAGPRCLRINTAGESLHS